MLLLGSQKTMPDNSRRKRDNFQAAKMMARSLCWIGLTKIY